MSVCGVGLGTDPSPALVLSPFDCAQGRLVEWIRMAIREIPAMDRRNDRVEEDGSPITNVCFMAL